MSKLYSLESMDGRVCAKVFKRRYAKQMVKSEYDSKVYSIPNDGICYRIDKNGNKKFAFMW